MNYKPEIENLIALVLKEQDAQKKFILSNYSVYDRRILQSANQRIADYLEDLKKLGLKFPEPPQKGKQGGIF